MSNKKTDIAQIRKYLQGELNARDQHELERAALDDPFLQDAMDGYAQSAADQQGNLNALDAMLDKRLNQAKVRRLSIWPYLAAASVILALTITYLLWPGGNESEEQLSTIIVKKQGSAKQPVVIDTAVTPALQVDKTALAANTKPIRRPKRQQAELRQAAPVTAENYTEPAAAAADKKAAPYAPVNVFQQSQANGVLRNIGMPKDSVMRFGSATAARMYDSIKLKEVSILGYTAKKKTEPSAAQVLLGKVEGVQVTTPDRRIHGTIYDETGHPLPGVSIRVKETQQAASTDINGRFSIAASGAKTLNIGFIGYLNKQVIADPNDSLKIELQPANNSLSEVVVVGYGTKIKQDNNPHPRNGWENYKRYLAQQAVAGPNIPEGTVKVSFTVGSDGALSDFKITKSLSTTADEKAISLVKNGAAWVAAANQKPKTITLKIRFKKQ